MPTPQLHTYKKEMKGDPSTKMEVVLYMSLSEGLYKEMKLRKRPNILMLEYTGGFKVVCVCTDMPALCR